MSIGVAAPGSFAKSDKTRSFCSSNNFNRRVTGSFGYATSASCLAELAASPLICTNCVCTVGVGTCVGGTYETRLKAPGYTLFGTRLYAGGLTGGGGNGPIPSAVSCGGLTLFCGTKVPCKLWFLQRANFSADCCL